MGWCSVWFVFLGRESGPVTSDIHETNKVSVVTSFKFRTIFLDFITNCSENCGGDISEFEFRHTHALAVAYCLYDIYLDVGVPLLPLVQ